MIQTSIKGSDGAEHLYQTTPFTFDESVAIQLELGRILGSVAGPVVEFASALFTLDGETGQVSYDGGKKGDDASAETLGRAIVAVPQGIMQAGGVAFIRRILANTSREVDILGNGTLTMKAITSENWLDQIYPGGNWGEMYLAVLWVLTVNFSPFGRVGSWTLKTAWEELMRLIPQLSNLSIGTSQPSADGQTASDPQTT